jgi:YjbE family integral membrane protein
LEALFTPEAMTALMTVLGINIVLSGDNAIVVGMVAARVAPENRGRIILWGMGAAVVLRIIFSIIAVYLLNIVGLTLFGGVLLLWVSWRLYRDITAGHETEEVAHAVEVATGHDAAAEVATTAATAAAVGLSMQQAITQVAIADTSMSLDNVLAVAGAAREHPWIMVLGLILSIAFMGVLANIIARLLQKYHWLSYVGLALIVWVAVEMCYHGTVEVLATTGYIAPAAEH